MNSFWCCYVCGRCEFSFRDAVSHMMRCRDENNDGGLEHIGGTEAENRFNSMATAKFSNEEMEMLKKVYDECTRDGTNDNLFPNPED